MTPQQQQIYNQILQYLSTLPAGTQFNLDKAFYQLALPNVVLTSGDKRAIGKYFRQQVQNKAIRVDFDYCFSNCPRCGYKDNQNHIYYITK